MKDHRVLSGMRPTGQLHLGHYHGVLKNWARLQNEYDSYYFVADWHAFTTHYSDKIDLETNVSDMIVDWLATGLNPNTSTLFVQSKVPEHAELHLLLSMSTPLSWLERVPSFKDQQEKLKTKDLSTYGFLGYPLLQSADILIYKAGLVPVGEDQVAHVEFTREVATLIWNGEVGCWTDGDYLAEAVGRAGFNLSEMDQAIEADPDIYINIIEENHAARHEVGHWGSPTIVIDGEPFFGQDRIELAKWRLAQNRSSVG